MTWTSYDLAVRQPLLHADIPRPRGQLDAQDVAG